MLEQRVELFLEQFNQKQRAEANKLDTAFTMRLFVGIIGDKALADVGAEDMDRWLYALAHWPPNATKRERYKDLSPREVVIVSKRKGEPPPSACAPERNTWTGFGCSSTGPWNDATWTATPARPSTS